MSFGLDHYYQNQATQSFNQLKIAPNFFNENLTSALIDYIGFDKDKFLQ